MNYKLLCPIRSTPADKNEPCCSGCGSIYEPIFVYESLLNIVNMLIKIGFIVTGTDFKYCTSHKTKITIIFAGNVPVCLFNALPINWSLQCLDGVYYLRCNGIQPDTMIKELEQWLSNINPEHFGSTLKLSGYDYK